MIVVDAKDSILGRVAAYVAKQALKGEEVAVVNCNKIIISGKKKSIKEEFIVFNIFILFPFKESIITISYNQYKK